MNQSIKSQYLSPQIKPCSLLPFNILEDGVNEFLHRPRTARSAVWDSEHLQLWVQNELTIMSLSLLKKTTTTTTKTKHTLCCSLEPRFWNADAVIFIWRDVIYWYVVRGSWTTVTHLLRTEYHLLGGERHTHPQTVPFGGGKVMCLDFCVISHEWRCHRVIQNVISGSFAHTLVCV